MVGEALVAFVVTATGEVAEGRLISADFPELGALALATVPTGEFAPGERGGEVVPVQIIVPFTHDFSEAAFDVRAKPRLQGQPEYPYFMRRSGISGRVVVEFTVNDKGRVEAAYANETSHPGFRQAAVDAVEEWRFSPAEKDGKPVAMNLRVPILFEIVDMPENRGWKIPRPKEFPAGFPDTLKWDEAPKLIDYNPPVYPRNALEERIRGKVKVQFVIAPHGGVVATRAVEADSPELAGAAVAAVETFKFEPARRNGEPCGASILIELDFRPTEFSDAPVTKETRRLLRSVKRNPDRIISPARLDAIPEVIFARQPVIPTVHRKDTEDGHVRVEVIISNRGTVELARVLEETSPAYGFAAIQALSEWQFTPPQVEGKFVDTRLIVPLVFRAQEATNAQD